MRVKTTTKEIELDEDYGQVECVEVSCGRCGHSEQSYGTDESAARRCAILLRENCPHGGNKYYVV